MDEWHGTPVGDSGAEQVVEVPGREPAFTDEEAVRYTASLPDPRDPDDEVAVLALDGVYAHAEVEVTGERLGGEGPVEHDAYFEPLRVPFRPGEQTEIAVTCHAPRDRFGGLHDTDAVPDEMAVPGIWWDASVETHPLPYVDDVRVRPEVTDDGARLHVRTTVVTDGPMEERVTYSLKPEGDLSTRGMMERGSVEATGPGKTTVEHTVAVRDPALWWPRALGDQHRYRLSAKLGDSERTVTTGICDVAREGGHLLVNGETLPVRGVNLLTDDPADVERALDLNATLVRGHAQVLPPAVYEACDEAGLLVWQDLPLTGPGEFDVECGRALAGTLADAYGNHPSFAAVGVHDEPVRAFEDGLGGGFVDGLRLRWRAWRSDYDRTPAERVADAVPGSIPTVPVVGGPGVDHDAAAYYPGWDYGRAGTIDALLDRYPADLLAEFGAASLGADVADAAGFDAAKHDARVDGGVEDSQAYQAEVISTVAETARRRGLGAVAFALRDTDGAGMGVYTTDGDAKRARSVLETAFEPAQAFLADPSAGAECEVVVVNDRPDPLSTTLAWEAGDEEGELDLTVDATGRWSDTLAIPAEADRVRLALAVDGDAVTNAYDL